MSGAVGGGLEDMRRGVELLSEQTVLVFDGLLKIALAEAEARAGDLVRADCDPRRGAGDVRPHRLSRVRGRVASGARRNAAEARSGEPCPGRSKLSWPRSPSPDSKERAASNFAPRSHSRSSINRPAARSTPTPSSRPRSKAFRRRRKCGRSPRRRRCSRRCRKPTRSKRRPRSGSD